MKDNKIDGNNLMQSGSFDIVHCEKWSLQPNRIIDIAVGFGQNWFIAVTKLVLFRIKTLNL